MKMGKKQSDGTRVPRHVAVISVYAPTYKAPVEEKEKFYSDLQDTLDTVSEHDLLLMVGDFNARVGSTEREDREDTWNGVKGFHGVGRMNEAGADLLSFCALNDLTIMNTCFTKKAFTSSPGSIRGASSGTVLTMSSCAGGREGCAVMLV